MIRSMKRRPLGETADRQAVKVLLKKDNPGWKQKRLIAIQMGFNTENSNAFIGQSIGVSEASVKRWFATFRKEGLDAVLQRDYGIGRPSKLSPEIEQYLLKGLQKAHWNTAQQARQQLQDHFKKPFNYKTVWTWLKKCAGVIRVPRPVHEKRNPAKADMVCRRKPLWAFAKSTACLDTERRTPTQTLAEQLPVELLLWSYRSH